MLWTYWCFCHLPSFCPPPTWPSASRLTTTIPIPIIVCRLTRLKRSNFLRDKSLRLRIWFMQTSDKLNKIKKGNCCFLEWPEILRMNERRGSNFRLRSWLAAVLRIFSAASVTSELYGHTRFTLLCYYFEKRNKGLYLRKTRSVLPS